MDYVNTEPIWQGLPIPIIGDGTPQNEAEQNQNIICYTDGSKIEQGPVGYGYVIKTPGNSDNIESYGNLGYEATVYQGEVVAVHKAAEYLNLTLDENDTNDVDFYLSLIHI